LGGAGGGVVGDVPVAVVFEMVVPRAQGHEVLGAGVAAVVPVADMIQLAGFGLSVAGRERAGLVAGPNMIGQ
jgi:hypothetical protein